MAKATVNLNDYFTKDDFAVVTQLPYAQWLNPQKDVYGLALKKEQAEIANFQPTEGWELKTVEFESGNVDFWVSTTPRMVVLNPVSQISNAIEGNATPLMMKHNGNPNKGVAYYNDEIYKGAESGQWRAYRPFLFILVDKNNKIISNPIVLNAQKMSHNTLVQEQLPLWCNDVFNVFKELGGKAPAGQKPTCSFLSHFVFEPLFDTKYLQSSKGKGKSQGWVCVGYKKPTADTWNDYALSRKSEQSEVISQFVERIMDYITPPKANNQLNEIDLDSVTDSDGVVDPTKLPPEIQAMLNEDGEIKVAPENVPF